MKIQPSVFRGSWYPDTPGECEKQIKEFIGDHLLSDSATGNRMGGIVPHAGWYYSGEIACRVFRHLKSSMNPDVVVIYGMHLHPESPLYLLEDGAWETPFGLLPIDGEITGELRKHFSFRCHPEVFSRDNTIELQLPFIKYFFPDVKIVPMGIPPRKELFPVGEKLVETALSQNKKLCVIGSTDLTHYGDNYGFTSRGKGASAITWVREENDRRIVKAIEALDPSAILEEARINRNACCSGAIAAALHTGKKMGAVEGLAIQYGTSYDKSPGDSFVGYVGAVF